MLWGIKISRRDFLVCLSSAVLLVLSFPKTNYFFLSFIGLIPLLYGLDQRSYSKAFQLSYLTGVMFFAGTLFWFVHVTSLGAVLLILYFSVYFGLFGLGVRYFSSLSSLKKMFVLPALWVVCEFLRAHLLSGFSWVSLGHSQYQNIFLIQIADITGVWGVSFLVVLFNVFIKEVIQSKTNQGLLFFVFILILGSVLAYGGFQINAFEKSQQELGQTSSLRIGIVQANIEQELKWFEPAWPDILDTYLALSKSILKENPDLIIWPETAFPGFLGESKETFERVRKYVIESKVPLLFGSVKKEGDKYFNAVVLLSGEGKIENEYDKIHLVPFGEYIPFRGRFPFLTDLIPIDDFSVGEKYTLFDLNLRTNNVLSKIATPICFEDTLGPLVRRFVNNGATLLVNVTNDGWFKDTKAPFLHLASSIFRAVENRRNLVRSANTGVSGFINPVGKVES
ncbi:Apolipoprotein N-acyltransferase / Copper homeostasis protein CutE, partial [hydrothermal vent metagenome]